MGFGFAYNIFVLLFARQGNAAPGQGGGESFVAGRIHLSVSA